ncbi:MAG TPA: Dyp-type peroxidase [Rhizomicrobium sp.]|nr:Dyp-type peroxidase [Rhizomicrobium sp.]
MSDHESSKASRRGFLKRAGLIAAAAGSGMAAPADALSPPEGAAEPAIEPFYGHRQTGILARQQRHTWFATFDLDTQSRDDLIRLLRNWTDAAAEITQGRPAPVHPNDANAPAESEETLGLAPARLTLTFGFGASLFASNGKDRYGLASQMPQALIELPPFPGDQLIEARTGGDLSVQSSADDPQVAFHAVRHLSQLAYGAARIRWGQAGFLPDAKPNETPRNLLGFKDGTNNPPVTDEAATAKYIFVGEDGPSWMRGGSYVVARRILLALEHWDRMSRDLQEHTIGRHRATGAPLGKSDEFDALDVNAVDRNGNPVTPLHSHVRLANAANNGGARILRRPYSFNDGINYSGTRWPPWRQGMAYDAGLFFVCYQRDPREGFIRIFSKLAEFDLLNQFATHTGGGLFACPGGAAPGEFIGERLFA